MIVVSPRAEIRKYILDAAETGRSPTTGEIDLHAIATLGYSSEDPDHPIEHLLDDSSGIGATRWASAKRDTTERILIEFDNPQSISRIMYEVLETECSRTQEVRIEASDDRGETYRQILMQEYSCSPQGATFEREDLRFDLKGVTHLRLTVIPNKNGSGVATLSKLRLFN